MLFRFLISDEQKIFNRGRRGPTFLSHGCHPSAVKSILTVIMSSNFFKQCSNISKLDIKVLTPCVFMVPQIKFREKRKKPVFEVKDPFK